MFETLAERSFMSLFIATLFAGAATGLSAALAFYITTYFWGFSAQQTGFLVLGANYAPAILGWLLI